MRIPVFELTRQNQRLWPELEEAIKRVIDSGKFIMGDEVASIEEQIAEMAGASYGIGVGNCSDALHLCVQACGIGPRCHHYSIRFCHCRGSSSPWATSAL